MQIITIVVVIVVVFLAVSGGQEWVLEPYRLFLTYRC